MKACLTFCKVGSMEVQADIALNDSVLLEIKSWYTMAQSL